jgi:flavodoxin
MTALIVYFSKFGNTKMVAEAIAEALESLGSVRVISSDQLTVSDLSDADVVVMGSPTHRMNLPEVVRPVFETLPRYTLRDTPIAAFDTSYKLSWWLARFTAARKLARKLRKLGGKQVIPPESFYVVEREGPLYDGEIERAKEWGKLIVGQLGALGG